MKIYSVGDAASVDGVMEQLVIPGSVVMVPTETVYGLVCRFDDKEAVERIYRMKGRDRGKPLALFVFDWRKIPYAVLNDKACRLASQHCPGPITIIVEKSGGGTVGFRVPDHPFILDLLKKSGLVLASTSANLSGEPNARNIQDALKGLREEPDAVVDGGEIPENSLASTVVDTCGGKIRILRQGALEINL